MTVTKQLIDNVNKIKTTLNEISVYNLDVKTAIELYYELAKKVNEVINELSRFEGVVSEEVVEQNKKLLYLLGEGLKKQVGIKIDELITNGTIQDLINNKIFSDLNTKIETFKQQTDEQFNTIESKIGSAKTVDLVLFMGQSNMAGRGVASESPVVPKGHGYEFRAISDDSKLYDVIEPFGVNENNASGIYEPNMKTGSLVSSFMINYYNITKTPIVGVSASKGGSSITEWQPNSHFLIDAISRYNKAKAWLESNGYQIRHKFMVWCQGETDGDNNMSFSTYESYFSNMVTKMFNYVDKCFLIRIGNHRDNSKLYDNIIRCQTNICKNLDNVILVSTKFASMADLGLMKDEFHYKQVAYNEVGAESGINTAYYITNNIKPSLYDYEYNNIFVPYSENDNNYVDDIIYNFYKEGENGLVDIEKCGKTSQGKIRITDSNMGYKKMKPFKIKGSKEWTIEFRIHPKQLVQNSVNGDVNTVQSGMLLANDNGTIESLKNFLFVNNYSNLIRIRESSSSSQIDFTVEKSILDEEHTYSIVCDGTNAKLYIDGVFKSSVSSLGINEINFTHMFGGYKNPVAPKNGYNYRGSCSYIGLYNRALTVDELN